MPIKSLYFDESGFTGYNLLDPVQPFFVIASTDLDPGVSEQILRTSFPRYQGPEFKFSRIWGSNNRNGLIEFGRHFASRGENAFIWMTDKRFPERKSRMAELNFMVSKFGFSCTMSALCAIQPLITTRAVVHRTQATMRRWRGFCGYPTIA